MEPHTPTPANAAALTPRLAGYRVLIVEDNALNRVLICDVLVGEGAEVVQAEDGRQGVDAVRAGPPVDAVLMDIQMPTMDGLEATRQIREELGCTALPIIAMTANATPQDRERCLAVGMNAHFVKPVPLDRLVEMLLEFLPPRAS